MNLRLHRTIHQNMINLNFHMFKSDFPMVKAHKIKVKNIKICGE